MAEVLSLTVTELEAEPVAYSEQMRKWSDVHFNKITLAVVLRINYRDEGAETVAATIQETTEWGERQCGVVNGGEILGLY